MLSVVTAALRSVTATADRKTNFPLNKKSTCDSLFLSANGNRKKKTRNIEMLRRKKRLQFLAWFKMKFEAFFTFKSKCGKSFEYQQITSDFTSQNERDLTSRNNFKTPEKFPHHFGPF